MKILYISNTSKWGGAGSALYNLVSSMQEKGHSCLVFLPLGDGRLKEKLINERIPYFQSSVPYSDTVWPTFKINIFRYFLQLFRAYRYLIISRKEFQRLIDKYRPDIVHTNTGPLDIAPDICNKRRIPHVWHMREYQDLDFGMTFMPSKIKFLNKIHIDGNYNIAITKGVYNYWKLRDGIDTVIYDGVFSEKEERICIEKKEKYVLFCGKVVNAKGLLSIINVWAAFKEKYPEYRLLIAGDAPLDSSYVQKCMDKIIKERVSESVEFMGMRNDVYSLMKHATMLIVPSRFEGFGFITAEAMLNGCVVVGRNTAGTKEQFDKGLKFCGEEIGYRFNSDEELLQTMLRAMSSNNDSMILNAQNTVFEYYTKERMSSEIEKYYRYVIGKY